LCFCFVDSVETCRMAELAQYVEGLPGHEISAEQSDYVNVSIGLLMDIFTP